MTFIVILTALLIERFFDWSHLRNWQGYLRAQEKLLTMLPSYSPYLILLISIIPILLVVALIGFIIHGWIYGFINLLFEIIVLLYCLGPRNLWADAFASINALSQGDAQFAEEKLKISFNMIDIEAKSVHKQLTDKIFIAANQRIFSVVFWFIVLGPIGAVLYRAITLTSLENWREKMPSELSQTAFSIEGWLEWIPVRIFTFLFALGGHFTQVLACMRQHILAPISNNDALLTECGIAALGQDSASVDSQAETHAINLIDRTLVILLVIVAALVWLI